MRVVLALLFVVVAAPAQAAVVPAEGPGRSVVEISDPVSLDGEPSAGLRSDALIAFLLTGVDLYVLRRVVFLLLLSNTSTAGGGPLDVTNALVVLRLVQQANLIAALLVVRVNGREVPVTYTPCSGEGVASGATGPGGDEENCGASLEIGDVAANEELEIEIEVVGLAPGTATLEATYSQAEFDPVPSNNTASIAIEVAAPPTLSGQKWLDLDGDGGRDDDEGPVDGVPIALADATGTTVAETLTGPVDLDADGAIDPIAERGIYRFDLPETPGAYTVAEPVPDGWTAIPSGGVHEVDVGEMAIDGLDFYNRPPPDLDLDFGDAPDSYRTLWPAGPSHFVFLGQLILGAEIDVEDDGVPTLDASGDDLFIPPPIDQVDDEDGLVGISFGDGGQGQLTVRTNAAGVLDAWFDFDGDGTFLPPPFAADDDHIVVAAPIPSAGEHTVTFDVPSGGRRAGPLRLRFHEVPGGLGVGGLAWDGEVEDHLVAGLDLGDANQDPLEIIPGMPFGYPVRISADGARHLVDDLVKLGENVDAETDLNVALASETGLASNTATGDDNDPDDNRNDGPRDDEDGVAFGEGFVPFTIQLPVGSTDPSAPNPLTRYGLVAGTTGTLTFFPNVDGGLDAWFDWNRDGDWEDDGEHVFANERMGPSTPPPSLDLQAPPNASVGYYHARFRFSRNGALNATGVAPDGEVEDYLMATFPPLDYGDAPAPYPSAVTDGGARHGVGLVRLGAEADPEVDPDADDSDDGVALPDELYRGADMAVPVTTAGDAPAALYAWVDWNADGDWDDDGEQAVAGEVLSPGSHVVTITPPADATPGTTWARFRLSRVALPFVAGAEVDPLVVPFVTEGEVEDYPVEIAANGVAAEDDVAPPETAIESVGPNPARASLSIRVALAERAETTVRLVDALGREVLAMPLGALPAGRHAVPFDVAALPAGLYVVVVDAGAHRLTRPIAVAR
ncbi:GEVED domain-containing protein [Rubrivirga marina]|uniref:GEVED domain-containing protein n=1 Tax=Rubrivirga marina TaxID=1196024 RepID=A0A271IZQ5_9BACT|nr:GEVED domain-containing protein [Rubrivirga marina]PAP76693.1 hypothetical protein BSZ37_09700 [Rubrivirga marina]